MSWLRIANAPACSGANRKPEAVGGGRKPMNRLVLEFLSAREISPAALVRLAARNHVPCVSVCINPFKALSGEAVPFADLIDWDLIGDTPNRRELKRLCAVEGIAIASADPFFIRSEADI